MPKIWEDRSGFAWEKYKQTRDPSWLGDIVSRRHVLENHIPIMVSNRKELVCIPKENDMPSILVAGCLDGETEVFAGNTFVKIKDIVKNQRCVSFDGERGVEDTINDHFCSKHDVRYKIYYKYQDNIRKSVICSGNHEFIVKRKNPITGETYVTKTIATDLKLDDKFPIVNKIDFPEKFTEYEGVKLDSVCGWLTGVFFACGTIHGVKICLDIKDKAVFAEVLRIFKNSGVSYSLSNDRIIFKSRYFSKFFLKIFSYHKDRFCDDLFNFPSVFKNMFISGLISAIGFCRGRYIVKLQYRPLVNSLRVFCMSVGVLCDLIEIKKDYFYVYIRGFKKRNSRIIKSYKVKLWCGRVFWDDCSWVKVIKIVREHHPSILYDISVKTNSNFMLADGLIVGNSKRCLREDTKVFASGKYKEIKDINIGDEVVTINGRVELEKKKVLDNVFQGERNIFHVVFDNGADVDCTYDHRFMVKSGDTVVEKRLNDFDETDLVPFYDGSKVKWIKVEDYYYIGKHNAYDLTVEGNSNYMLANGVFTHNTGKSLTLLSIASSMYYSMGWYVAFMNEMNRESYTAKWGPRMAQRHILEKYEMFRVPKMMPYVHVVPSTKNAHIPPGVMKWKVCLPISDVLENPEDYLDVQASGNYLSSIKEKLGGLVFTIDTLKKMLEKVGAQKGTVNAIITRVQRLYDDGILDICPNNLFTENYVQVKPPDDDVFYLFDAITGLMVAGAVPILHTDHIVGNKRFFVKYLTSQIEKVLMNQMEHPYFVEKRKKTCLIIDELTGISRNDRSGENPIIRRAVIQGGPMGLGTVYATQNPSKVDEMILSNTKYVISCQNAKSEARVLTSQFGLSDTYADEITHLVKRNRECVAFTSERFVVYDIEGNSYYYDSGPIRGTYLFPPHNVDAGGGRTEGGKSVDV